MRVRDGDDGVCVQEQRIFIDASRSWIMSHQRSTITHAIRALLGESAHASTGIVRSLGSVFSRTESASSPLKTASRTTLRAPPRFQRLRVVKTLTGVYDTTEQRVHTDSLIVLIFGKRGSGKSALGFTLLENVHAKTQRPAYVLGIHAYLPAWITPLDQVQDAHNGGVILVDEGAVAFSSRESMRLTNRDLAKLLAIARHKNLTLIFITQNTGMIDKSVLKLADVLMVKEGSLLQQEMERAEIRTFYEKSKKLFDKITGDKRPYAYVIDADFEGVVKAPLPSFWTEGLSKNKAGESTL